MIKFIQNIFNKTQEKQKILFFCGAGLSQESGLNTFRDANGIWENHSLEEVCDIRTYRENKEKVFKFYNDRKKQILQAQPNHAHKTIAKIQKEYGVENVLIFTSNIDTLLTKAGCENVTHVHGDILHMQCTDCDHHWHIGEQEYSIDSKCPNCQSQWVKPSIVFFYELAPKYKELHQAFEMGGPIINGELTNNIKVVIGTSFKVIGAHTFQLYRGNSIILDKVFPSDIEDGDCSEIIIKTATEGIEDVKKKIAQWYIT